MSWAIGLSRKCTLMPSKRPWKLGRRTCAGPDQIRSDQIRSDLDMLATACGCVHVCVCVCTVRCRVFVDVCLRAPRCQCRARSVRIKVFGYFIACVAPITTQVSGRVSRSSCALRNAVSLYVHGCLSGTHMFTHTQTNTSHVLVARM